MGNDFAIAGQQQVGFLEHGCSLNMYQGGYTPYPCPLFAKPRHSHSVLKCVNECFLLFCQNQMNMLSR